MYGYGCIMSSNVLYLKWTVYAMFVSATKRFASPHTNVFVDHLTILWQRGYAGICVKLGVCNENQLTLCTGKEVNIWIY